MNSTSYLSKQAIRENTNPNLGNSVFDISVTYSLNILHRGRFGRPHGVCNSKKSKLNVNVYQHYYTQQ